MADAPDPHGPVGPHDQEPVGSLGQETLRLLRALADDRAGVGAADAGPWSEPGRTSAAGAQGRRSDHECTTGWCPVCRVVGFVKENPAVVEEVGLAALHLARTVRDAFDVALRQTTGPGDTGSTGSGSTGSGPGDSSPHDTTDQKDER